MLQSMTAFANRTGAADHVSWVWEIRGVNARGLDLRFRLPDQFGEVEQALRAGLTKALARGNVTVGLRLRREPNEQAELIDQTQLDTVLTALDTVQDRAFEMGVTLGQPTAADVLAHRGVLTTVKPEDDNTALSAAVLADIGPLIDAFVDMRLSEGASLERIISDQLTRLDSLTKAAAVAAAKRAPDVKKNLTEALRRVVDDVGEVEEGRIAQELALLAIKSDVTEEIDRLNSHIQAAHEMIAEGGPIGRKFDFLTQEFNREANTLCAKAHSTALTAIGLDLKAVIDQMREQIQNVE